MTLTDILAALLIGALLGTAALLWCEPEAQTVDDMFAPHAVGGSR